MIRNNYKQNDTAFGMGGSFNYNKEGQVAIFVIVAVVIVAIVLGVLIYPKLNVQFGEAFTPQKYLKSCIEPELRPVLEKASAQGGYLNPDGFILYNDTKVKYLCYTSENYKTCVVQEPALVSQVEKEIYNAIQPKINGCFDNLKKEYERRGYSVSASKIDSSLDIISGKINLRVNAPMTVTKDVSQTFKGFDVTLDSQIYDLLITATSIVDFESNYGDSDTKLYMQYYPNLRIEKTKLSDGTKIYKLTNVVSDERFTFASKSLSWPPGYNTR